MNDTWRKLIADFFDAARRGQIEEVRRLLQAGIHVDVRDEWGRTPLMLAAGVRQLPVVRVLLAQGADVNARDELTWTAMTYAVNRPSPHFSNPSPFRSTVGPSRAIFEDLVDAGGAVCLREAVILGDVALTETLCEDGADADGDARWFYYDTYLMVAIDLDYPEVARALLPSPTHTSDLRALPRTATQQRLGSGLGAPGQVDRGHPGLTPAGGMIDGVVVGPHEVHVVRNEPSEQDEHTTEAEEPRTRPCAVAPA